MSGEEQEKPHRKLKVWQASMDFVIEIYNELQRSPAHEKFALTGRCIHSKQHR